MNPEIMIKFIGFMVKYILDFRKDMFKFEDFKNSIRDKDHIVLLVEYEKKVREYA